MKKTILYICNIIALLVFGLYSPQIMAEYAEKADNDTANAIIAVDVMPEIINTVTPEYPEKAKQEGLACLIYIKAYINASGKTEQAQIERCSLEDQGFEESAIKAALATKYKPAIKNNKPVAIWITYKVIFSLESDT